jgi:hypothetical protein
VGKLRVIIKIMKPNQKMKATIGWRVYTKLAKLEAEQKSRSELEKKKEL